MRKTLLTSLLLLLLCASAAEATHLRSAYITYTTDKSPTPNLRKLFFTLTVFTDRASAGEEPFVQINNGDGITRTVHRSDVVNIGYVTDKETYTWEHTYPGDGTYLVSWNGTNRNALMNTTAPVQQYSMLIYTSVNISSFNPNGRSPVFALPPLAEAYIGHPFKYNLLAYDTDGDSLSYSLTTPAARDANGNTFYIPGYRIPEGLTINQFGEISWPSPTNSGEYSLAVVVKEYRNRRLMSTYLTELQLRVRSGQQVPEFTLVNRNHLVLSGAGYIFAPPGAPLKLTYFVKNPVAGPLHVAAPVSELLAPHLADRHTFTATQRDSAGGVVHEFVFVPAAALERAQPYAIGVRGALGASPVNPDSYKYEYVYLLVGEQKSASSPGLLPQQQLMLYPNPATDNFTIEAPATASSLLTLYSPEGRVVWQAHLLPGTNVIARPAGLASGLYTYLLYSSQNSVAKRGRLVLQ